MANYKCTYCGFQYNEWHGDCKNGIPAETPYSALAGSLCQRCGLQGERHVRAANSKYTGLEAEYYDLFVGKGGQDLYRNWILRSEEPPYVLELGVGTGRIALELAKYNIPVTGVDWSSEMLDVARKKANRLKREVTFLEEDVTTLDLNKSYSHILLSDGFFQHFTTVAEQKDLLAVIRKHLKKDGLVAIDLVLPPNEPAWKVRQRKQLTDHKMIYFTVEGVTSIQRQLFHYTATYESYRKGTLQSQYRVERELSIITPRELVYLLMLDGFYITEIIENYQFTTNLWESMKVSELNDTLTYLYKEEMLEEKEAEINAGLLYPYQEDRWNEGGYPFGVKSFNHNSQSAKWTILATIK
ncbi:methyltransferase domain-containing protein [Halalkalibacter alkalisediminis]|uniref:Methyltransferase domain-containing protein n=1 Tax=Halalkalibacter alkalisediminis TaxID=935616 RepID=A0ABV6NF67_9BACI|nr:methyltransferase domain-containing protein [Halalkalibacter alkalisediminis]